MTNSSPLSSISSMAHLLSDLNDKKIDLSINARGQEPMEDNLWRGIDIIRVYMQFVSTLPRSKLRAEQGLQYPKKKVVN